ncbi:hypothetical protein [Streptomyces lasalocidi]|uniref:Uncharacterized protein n=1 Tax=Streptomyces lasalocidi TaxID=324833 RepID=A0A4U5WMM8_STRLS|nr:hypothetical protein [Streptomyces lasalocidi]TKT03445.1 hypothetical protein E4U91_27360 [Streptomyces lasalocidi]
MENKTYTFEHNGETIAFERDFSGLRSPKWLRENRRRDELDLLFTLIEEFGGEDVVAAVDDMDDTQFADFSEKLGKEMSKAMKEFGARANAAK